MLHQFLTTNRIALIGRCRAKVAQRSVPTATPSELEHGIPQFLDQLIRTLRAEQASDIALSLTVSGAPGGQAPDHSEIGATAKRHGHELSNRGYTVDQVVHDYGDLCQAVTELALEQRTPIQVDEFRTLNRCLDNAIADAVTEFSYQRDSVLAGRNDEALDERLRVLAHELRSHIQAAAHAVTAIKDGTVGLKGATGAILDLSLDSLRSAIDRSLADAWATAGLPARHRLMSVTDFIAEAKRAAAFEARRQDCRLVVAEVENGLAVDADRDLLLSAVGQLLQNAFNFTVPRSEVSLRAFAVGDRVMIEVADHCGGLPPGVAGTLFLQADAGHGLWICRRSVEANNGVLKVRDLPGEGCIFTIDLPRRSLQ